MAASTTSYSQAAQAGASKVPQAFFCASSRSIMQWPVLHLACARIFEKAVVEQLPTCPFDRTVFDETSLIDLPELKKRIQNWEEISATAEDFDKLRLAVSPAALAKPEKKWVIKNAHQDDIHGLALCPQGVASCSKDGIVKRWNRKGQFICAYNETEGIDYRKWMTAIGTHPKSSVLLAGTRDGCIDAYGPDGEIWNKKDWRLRPKIQTHHTSKQRNINRIACLTLLPERDGITPFFAGVGPTLNFASIDNSRKNGWFTNHSATQVHKNDWVYCVQPVDATDPLGNLLIVIGAQMSQWQRNREKDPYKESAWENYTPIVQEDKGEVGFRKGKPLRPHIASIVSKPAQPSHVTYACFENNRGYGPIRTVDLQTKKIIFNGEEHVGRSWSVSYVSPHVFASGADDHKVKLWDPRFGNGSIQTLPEHVGRVSGVISPADNILLTASCPDNVHASETKAELICWDLRMPNESI